MMRCVCKTNTLYTSTTVVDSRRFFVMTQRHGRNVTNVVVVCFAIMTFGPLEVGGCAFSIYSTEKKPCTMSYVVANQHLRHSEVDRIFYLLFSEISII